MAAATAGAGTRYRLVTITCRREPLERETFTSTVVLGQSEILDQLEIEGRLAKSTGWVVHAVEVDGWVGIRCVKQDMIRTIYARGYSAMEDLPL